MLILSRIKYISLFFVQ